MNVHPIVKKIQDTDFELKISKCPKCGSKMEQMIVSGETYSKEDGTTSTNKEDEIIFSVGIAQNVRWNCENPKCSWHHTTS